MELAESWLLRSLQYPVFFAFNYIFLLVLQICQIIDILDKNQRLLVISRKYLIAEKQLLIVNSCNR